MHLLAAGCWPVGLVPFAIMLYKFKRSVEQSVVFELTARFSAMSLICVSFLTATGLVNTWVLLGSVSNLWQTVYGRVLLVKIFVFCVMVGIGAVNLLRLKPRLAAGDDGQRAVEVQRDDGTPPGDDCYHSCCAAGPSAAGAVKAGQPLQECVRV